jgi:diadenosine tetraphosphate (Ap4A) HIT family hydrolase
MINMNNSDCIFCKEENPLIKNELAYTTFDKFPITKFHVLIISKRHVETFFELTLTEKISCFDLLGQVKEKLVQMDKTISGFNVGFNSGKDAGQTIMHCHIHLIPRREGDVLEPQGGIRNVIPGKGKY